MTSQRFPLGRLFQLSVGLMLFAGAAPNAGLAQEKPVDIRPPAPASIAAKDDARYCTNIADAAADARFAWQKETLANLEKELDERIKVLEAKRAEYEVWLKRRNEFLDKADAAVIAIYSRMKPEAAAQQLANMTEETAAAILMKLNPRSASAVLNEMEPARAAMLTTIITDAAKRTQDNEKSG